MKKIIPLHSSKSSASIFALLLAIYSLGALLVLTASAMSGKSSHLIVGDGKGYYAWARSIVFDGDIQFENDYKLMSYAYSSETQVTAKGNIANKYPIGIAIIELPGVLLGHLAAKLVSAPSNGFSLPYQISIAFSLSLFCIWSFYFLFQAMKNFGVNERWAVILCFTALAGTNLVHYVAKEPTMAHAAGTALINMILFQISRWPNDWGKILPRERWLLGVLLGLLLLCRNSNIFALPAIAFLILRNRKIAKELLGILAAMAIVGSIQIVAVYELWGSFIFKTYHKEGFTSGFSGVVNTLFSHRNGLFVHHPWYIFLLLLTAGAALFGKSNRGTAIWVTLSFLMLLAINGTWWCWWFAVSFGNRAFIEALPLLSLASGLFLTELKPSVRKRHFFQLVAIAACLLNLYLWTGMLFNKYSPGGASSSIVETYLWPANYDWKFL